MHLHCHLADCVRDFGPVYSFWLFSFERYNGHLGSLPNNGRSIEVQMMRRFTRDSYINSIQLPEKLHKLFENHFTELQKQSKSEKEITDDKIRHILYLSKRSAPIANQDWENVSAFGISTSVRYCLKEEEHKLCSKSLPDNVPRSY